MVRKSPYGKTCAATKAIRKCPDIISPAPVVCVKAVNSAGGLAWFAILTVTSHDS
jgi:hypothetical protein